MLPASLAGHDEVGENWARITSLIGKPCPATGSKDKANAKMNGVRRFGYLTATLEAIATGHPSSKLHELLP